MSTDVVTLAILFPTMILCATTLAWQHRNINSENDRLKREHLAYVNATKADISYLKTQVLATQVAIKKISDVLTKRTGKDPLTHE
jgi:hypothetical protein